MHYLAIVVIIIALVFAIIQDFRHRAISWIILPWLLVAGIIFSCQSISFSRVARNALINNAILLFYLLFLTLYFSVKEKKRVNIINSYLGIGDVLFLVSLSVLFSPLNFIVFVTFSLLITLIVTLVILKVKNPVGFTIPLAGAMSLLLIPVIVQSIFIEFLPLSNDSLIMSLFFNYV